MNSPAIVEINQLKVDKSDLEIAALLRAIPGIHTLSALIAIDPVTLSSWKFAFLALSEPNYPT